MQQVRWFLLFAFLIQWLQLVFVLKVSCRPFHFVLSTTHRILAFGLQVILIELVLLSPEFDRVLPMSERRLLVALVEAPTLRLRQH